jgi:sulfate permease, SulP family
MVEHLAGGGEVAKMAIGNQGNWFARVSLLMQSVYADGRALLAKGELDAFPLGKTLRGYGRRSLVSDLKAGASVSLLAIPQGVAYAMIAGLPLHYGITCSAAAALVGPLLASSRHTVFGPTNATAFMVFSYFAAYPYLNQLALMPLLVFMTAALLILGSFLRVADLAQYISRTVVVAYVTGAALLIVANQVPGLLGLGQLQSSSDASAPVTFPGLIYRILQQLSETSFQSVLTATLTFGVFGLIKKYRPQWPPFAFTLVAVTTVVSLLNPLGFDPPTFADQSFTWRELLPVFPDFASSSTLPNISRLFGLALAMAFLCTLENAAMAKTLASRSGRRVDANQDMLSLGVANLACAYTSGMPASASLTRSALNFESGARTGLASVFSGLFCLIVALTLGGWVTLIPKAVLAALVICVASSLINRRHLRICLNATKSDAVVFVSTFVATLFVPLHVAIFTGIGISVMLYLRKASRPQLIEYAFNEEGQLAEAEMGKRQNPSISIVHVEGELFFGAAELFRTQIQRTCADPNLRLIILRLKNARHLDATSVMALEELIRVLRADGRDLIVSGAMKDVYRVLKDSGLVKVIGKANIFLGSPSNPNLSTRNALKRAQEILGRKDADVRIYFDPSKGT